MGAGKSPKATGASGATSRLRSDIDAGLTGDKVSYSDPAAVPLGADDEAAGVASSDTAIEASRLEQLKQQQEWRERRSGAGWPWPSTVTFAIAIVLALLVATAFYLNW